MKMKPLNSLPPEIIRKLFNDQELSTAELVMVLENAGVHILVIDYIADLHAHKVEGKTSTPATISERIKRERVAFVAVQDEYERARRNGKKISQSEAIKRAAKRAGISPSTMRRHLKPSPNRKHYYRPDNIK